LTQNASIAANHKQACASTLNSNKLSIKKSVVPKLYPIHKIESKKGREPAKV